GAERQTRRPADRSRVAAARHERGIGVKIMAAVMLGLSLSTAVVAQTSQPSSGLIHRAGSTATSQSAAGAKAASDDIGTFRVVLSLAAVVGLIVLMYWASRRLMPRHGFGG